MKEMSKQVSKNRLAVIEKFTLTLGDLKDNIADESQQRAALEKTLIVRSKIKQEKVIGCRKATSRW